ncbi:toll-like receptor 4 [Littorina saxatilis]|uniref:Uncharacterized protein n=1 Tax=Littorina saxatilis TaxID=31220 RepID=A0AAN9GHW5_9CAEN
MFHVFPCIALMCGLFPLTRGFSCTESQQAEGLSLDSSHRHLTSLPDTPSEKVTKFDVTYNDLSKLPEDTLSSWFPALQQLDASHNAITAIDDRTFQGLSELHDLDLSYNQLQVMHNGTLSDLSSSLRTLSLSHNRLQQLDDTAFRGLATLTSLSLDNNNLTSLTASTFSGLVSLRYLDLSYNALTSILNNTFADLVSLRSLRLDHNQMEHLEPAALAGLKQLVDIHLNDNRLEFFHWSLPAGVFADLQSVERFELKFNSRSNTGGYPEGVFGDLVAVRYLALDSFVDMDFGPEFARLSHIETLDVADSCKVNTLRNSSLLGFKNSSLQSLQLTSCHSLLFMETCAFCDLPHLKNLYLTHSDALHTGEAFRALYGLQGQSLDEINFRAVGRLLPELHIIDSNMTKYIHNVCVRTFIMSHAHIQRVIHNAMFHTADSQLSRCIQHVDLSENNLNGDLGVFINIFVHTKTLISLQLQEQHVYSLKGSACVLSVAPECGNRGSSTPPSWPETFHLPFPPSLHFLNLSAMFTFFNSMPPRVDAPSALGLKTLDLSFGFTSHCMTTFTGFQHLETFDFSGNYCNNISDNIFDHLLSLRHLSLSSAHLNPADIRTRAHRLLQHVDRLETLDLSWNWLVEIQGHSLPAQSRLQRLLLSHNSFQSLPVDVGLHPNLTDLDLSFNSVPSLTSVERDSLDELASRHLFRLNLRGNPMLCACSNLNFLRWMWDTHVILDGDGSSGRR